MDKFAYLREIETLDPERDHQRIVHLSASYDFPFTTARALEFALFRTFASPSIARTLHESGAFERATQKRYDDTDIILSHIYEYGYDSDLGKRAIRRMNNIHRRFNISNEDYLYVLGTFVIEPIRWNARLGWRPLHENEKQAAYVFWRELGKRMNIREIPESLEALTVFYDAYEQKHFRYNEASRKVGDSVVGLLLGWFLPKRLHPYAAPVVHALMDDPLREAFGYPPPPAWLKRFMARNMRLFALTQRLMPPRRTPRLRTANPYRSYPEGYTLEEVGAPPVQESSST